jgi:enediyne polyketide synthase
VRLALLGRSSPGEDEVLAANLARLRAASAELRYERADVGDAEAVRRAFRDVESALGPVTAVLHAAGENLPTLLGDLDPELFRRTVAPKVDGARNLLAAADPARLHTFVAFSSIIRRVGLPGEAHYATANEWLARVVEKWSAGAPGRRGLVVDWSVWAGVGMGERLGRVQALRELGVMPITTDDGVRALADLVGQESARGSIVVTGRFGDPPTLAFEPGETPFLRFLEDVRWHVPGVEIVADSQVSVRSDPYLEEHVLRGERLLPAVMGLEAMAQAWRALTGRSDAPVFENVQFHRPIAVAPHGVTTIRCAALACGDGQDAADVVLRTDATSFRAEHFRATCRASSGARGEARVRPSGSRLDALVTDPEALLPDPERDLYGAILFHAGRFRRLRRYRRLRATECVAEIGRGPAEPWFERTLPQELVLGDAAARDAAVHAVQACIPHAVVLPVAVEAIERWPLLPGDDETGLVVRARERSRSGDEFVYDLEIAGADGRVREAWSGLRLKAVEPIARGGSAPPLLAPWVERRLGDLVPGADVHVAVARNGGLSTGKLAHRPDGKPQADGIEVSVARTDGLTLAVAGPGPLGCDVEAIVERPAAVWRDLLGLDGWSLASVLVAQAGESEATAATRVWAAAECLKKAGVAAAGAVSFVSRADDGWMLLSSGSLVTATVALLAGAGERPVVLAIATRARGT